MRATLLLFGVLLHTATSGYAAVLDSPKHGALVSGIGFISGWKCEAGTITVRVDGGAAIPVAMGMPRADTRPHCGDTDNGFIVQYNWNWLGEGRHSIIAYDDGVSFAGGTFTVGSTGEEFLTGISPHCEIPDFPTPGEVGLFAWNESTQHLELATVRSPSETGSGTPLRQSKLYWPHDTGIRRANLDGSQRETIVPREPNTAHFSQLAVDPTRGKLYWRAYHNDRYDIQRANLDGSQVETLVSVNSASLYNPAVAPHEGHLYWIMDTNSTQEIRRANLDGSQVETIIRATRNFSNGLEFYQLLIAGNHLYWRASQKMREEGKRQRELRRANLDGSAVEILFTIQATWRWRWVRDIAVDPTGGKVYWTTGGDLWRANLDGSDQEAIVKSLEAPNTYDEEDIIDGPDDLVVDPTAGKLYWTTDDRPQQIRRANLDGSQQEILFELEEREWATGFVLIHP